jgi:hypothetical protein
MGNFTIPFETEGNTIYFVSRVPTLDELTECQYITLTDDADWDPSMTDLTDYVPKEIKQVDRIWLDDGNGESDCILSSISSVYSEIAMRD